MKKKSFLCMLLIYLYLQPLYCENRLSDVNDWININSMLILESAVNSDPAYITGDTKKLGFRPYDHGYLPKEIKAANRMYTFRTKFYLDEKLQADDCAMYIGPVEYPYDIYLNGSLLHKIGRHGTYYNSSIYNSSNIYLLPDLLKYGPNPNELCFQIFPQEEDNPFGEVKISSKENVSMQVFLRDLLNVHFTQAIFILAIGISAFFLALFITRKMKELRFLYFALICIFFAMAEVNFSFNSGIIDEVMILKLSRIGFPFSAIMLVFFITEFTSILHRNKPLKIILLLLASGTSVLVLLQSTKQGIQFAFMIEMMAIIAPALIFSMTLCTISFIKKRNLGTFFMLFSFIIVILAGIHDMYFSNSGHIPYTWLISYGYFSLLLAIFFILAIEQSQLYMEAKKLADDLNVKNESLKQLDKLKDSFLANTSHELRTPLNGIIGIAESLADGAAGTLPERANFNLSMIINSGKRLSSLINDILDFSKLKVGDLYISKKPVQMRVITDIVINLSQPLLMGKDIVLKNEIEKTIPNVYGDENRLQQVMHNLIGNAIKFTDKGEVTISAKERGSSVVFTVSDTGIGIPGDKFDILFNSFEQVDSSIARKYGGTGIGLSITKKLLELQDGTIRVESQSGKGSDFIFTLPICTEYAEQNEEVIQTVSTVNTHSEPYLDSKHIKSKGSHRILIVDDEPVNLQVLINHLSLSDYEVIMAVNGEEAISACMKKQKKPDLVLLDIMMPTMSGYEVCHKIRESYPINELPVIFLTAKNQVSDLVECFNSGANDYIAKPFSKNELLSRVRTQLELSKLNLSYARFVPKQYISFLGRSSIIEVKLGDHIEKDISIMFSDIRSFTTLSEKMTPEDNFKFLNSYLGRIGPIIRNNNGVIDKYIGDAIMALFPASNEDALKSGIEMLKELTIYNNHRSNNGYSPIRIGIGIHAGSAMLGTIGDEMRMDGTVIADSVNIASRLEDLTKIFGIPLIISEQALLGIKDAARYNYRYLGKVRVKGKNELVSIFEVFDGDDEATFNLKQKTKSKFEEGVKNYVTRKFGESKRQFDEIIRLNPGDHAARYYLNRILKVTETVA